MAADVAVISSALSEADTRLAFLGGEIARLKEEESTLSSHRARTSTILSPLRRFPPEILAEIFMWSIPTTPSGPGRTKRAGAWCLDSPWLLTHSDDRSSWIRPLPMLELQIARALKLQISFFASPFGDSESQIEMFRCLSKHAAMWEELDLVLTPTLIPLLADLKGRLPALRRSCVLWYNSGSAASVGTINFLETAPSLVDVTIRSTFRHIPSFFPAHNLTRYEMDGPWRTHRRCRASLRARHANRTCRSRINGIKGFPRFNSNHNYDFSGYTLDPRILHTSILARNLVEAHIEVTLTDDPWPNSGELIELLSLRRLRVSAPQVLKYIQTPALEELATTFHPPVLPIIVDVLRLLLSRSSCHLRVLALFGCPDAETSLALLQEIPSLIKLRIVIDSLAALHGANALLAKLTVSDGSPALAPHLLCISLGISSSVVSGIDYPAYLQMLQSRWKSEHCALTSSRLLVCTGHGPFPTFEELKLLRREGFDYRPLFNQDASSGLCRWMYSSSSIQW
ncbi:hypothetical protein C8R46DRAFT_1255615 [Mycena filopes]|nr:hypothetical protein C8R46DRAFT_1255615 [Mycena filopes]